MKTTRAYVINIKKVICFLLVILFVLGSFITLTMCIDGYKVEKYLVGFSFKTIKKDIPFFISKDKKNFDLSLIKIISLLLNEDLDRPTKILKDKLFFIESVKKELSNQYDFMNESNNYYINKVIKEMITESKEENIIYNPATEKTIKSIRNNGTILGKKGITLDNKTSHSVDLNKLFHERLNLDKEADNPQVLIVHTHGSESYNPFDRSQDKTKNIVKVGSEMVKVFKENGINVIHSEKMHDIPMFNNSYKNSLATVNEMLKKYPDIKIVLDIHRDAMITESGEVFKVIKDFNGKKFAQVMFVVGTDEGGLSHENWRENLKFAIQCQKRLNEIVPDIARPINLRKERFNQHTTNASVIIEIGTNGNTLLESVESGKITAQAISDVLKIY